MSKFINTIDLLGDEAVTKALVEKTITEFNDDVITKVGMYAFCNCTALTSVTTPLAVSVESNAFENCTALTSLDFPLVTSISGSYDFSGCRSLSALILRSSTLCTLSGTTSFSGTPFSSVGTGGTLLVPRSLTTEYPNATNWSVVISRNANIRVLALEDYTVDGTITGEIDWDKLNGGN